MIRKLRSLFKRQHYIYSTEEEIKAINKAITRQMAGNRAQEIQGTEMGGGAQATDTASPSMC